MSDSYSEKPRISITTNHCLSITSYFHQSGQITEMKNQNEPKDDASFRLCFWIVAAYFGTRNLPTI